MNIDAASAAAGRANGQIGFPSLSRCMVAILAIKIALRLRGYGWTLQWIRQHVVAIPAILAVKREDAANVERAVATAGALFPGRALCLEQSLALYYLLRRQGIAVKYCQGIQAHPFEAHAWVEYRGFPLNDVAEHARLFEPFPDQLP
jgi:hypothetical protein